MTRTLLYAIVVVLYGTAHANESLSEGTPVPTVSAEQPLPQNEPEAGAPRSVSVKVLGQTDAVRGDLIALQLVTTGDVTATKWMVSPAVSGLVVLDGGRSAVFANRNAGVYRIVVAVSGENQVDLAEHELEILDDQSMPAPHPEGQRNAEREPFNSLDRDAALENDMLRLLNTVPSRSRSAEAKILGGCFRTTANRIEAGLFPAHGDPLADVERQAVLALGSAAPAWQNVLHWTKDYLAALNERGLATTPSTAAPILSEFASILARVR